MRVRIDRGGEALRLELGAAAAARRVEAAADGVAVAASAASTPARSPADAGRTG